MPARAEALKVPRKRPPVPLERARVTEVVSLVDDMWIDAFVTGYELWPDTRLGAWMLTLAKVVDNPPANWYVFAHSARLSDEQAVRFSSEMTEIHQRHGIHGKEVAVRDAHLVWQDTVASLFQPLVRARSGAPAQVDPRSGNAVNDANIAQVTSLFIDEQFVERRRQLEEATLRAREILLSREGRDLAWRYRYGIAQEPALALHRGDKTLEQYLASNGWPKDRIQRVRAANMPSLLADLSDKVAQHYVDRMRMTLREELHKRAADWILS